MKIVITGANGYIGKKLKEQLDRHAHEWIPVKRELWDGKTEEISDLLAGTDAVINLAGAPVLTRWTQKNKNNIYQSRVSVTQKLTSAILLLPKDRRPKTFISASAVGIYHPLTSHTEQSTDFDTTFISQLVQDWEAASSSLPADIRRVIFRIGLVIAHDSQTIQSMLPAFKLNLGGKIGNGRQAFPFIHADDLIAAFRWALNNNEEGIFNLVAPQTISNKEFTRNLAKALNKSAFFTIPEWILKLIFGEAAQLLTQSPIVIPERLHNKGFTFQKPNIASALSDLKQLP